LIIEQFKFGGLNIHPSLLPKYRGAAPIHHVLLNGEKETGVSIIELDTKKMDHGNILDQVVVPISEKIRFLELHDKLAIIGAERMKYALENIERLKLNPKINEGETMHAPKVVKSDGALNLNENKQKIYNKWRALGDNITVFTFFRKKRLLIRSLLHPDEYKLTDYDFIPNNQDNGMFFIDFQKDIMFIKVSDGWLACNEIQVEGFKSDAPSNKFRKEFKAKEKTIYHLD
jgi:methionyl-tRNA formyltransferase